MAFLFLLVAVAALPARGLVKLQNIRYYSYPEYTRVVLDLSGEIKVAERILKGGAGGRLFFDLNDCRFASDYPVAKMSEISIESGNLRRIRLGRGQARIIRVVFDFDRIGKYNRFYLTSPFRVVFDIYRQVEFVSRARQAREQPSPPLETNPSIARQLGLGVHRIVIDPGHGGKDPGAVNRHLGLREKDLTLDIAKRLNAILNEHEELEVILTRARDEYVALEERAAIANSNQGDIFVSIHTNSAPRLTARGIESYYLNITTDPWAMQVAAQENAMINKSMADMRSILNQILQNSKISESKIFSGFLQESLVASLKRKCGAIDDLGVKKAPFYVLLGAQMPSALVEVSFLSNAEEAGRLASPEYRQAVASGLYLGIVNFIRSLGKQ